MNKIKIDKKIIITFLLAAIIIVFINKLNINGYIKNVILPFSIMISSYIFLLSKNKFINRKAYYYLIPVILILISNFIVKTDDINNVLNIIILPVLISVFLFIYVNKNYKISETSFKWVFKLFPKGLFSNLKYLKLDLKNKNSNKIKNLIIGILLGSLIGFIILSLLTSADDYFNSFISFLKPSLNINFGNIILFVISFIVLFSIFVNIILNQEEKMEVLKKKKLDDILVLSILWIINIVFMLFLISEISRITVNFLNIPQKYTYSSYAREGFFQMLFVTIINFIIILYVLYKTNKVNENKNIKRLILSLIMFSIILIIDSYYRMFLYIGHYGLLTVLRFQVIIFLLMEFLIFILLIKKVLKGLKNNDWFIFYIIMVIFYLINLYLCNESVVSFVNKTIR